MQLNTLPSNYVRIAVSTMPTIVIKEDGCSRALLGYNSCWKEFDPIGGGYMIEKRDLQDIHLIAPSAALEMHISQAKLHRTLHPIAAISSTIWVEMKDALNLFDLLFPIVDVCGVKTRIVDARFIVEASEQNLLLEGFQARKYGISPAKSEMQELCEELGFEERDGYRIAPNSVIQEYTTVIDTGSIRRTAYNSQLGMHSTYLDYRPTVQFGDHLLHLIVEHAGKSRQMDDPLGRLILASANEICNGQVEGKDHHWKIPVNNAIDLKLLD